MSSGENEPRLNRRTVTMDQSKVVKEVVQESALAPIRLTKEMEIAPPLPAQHEQEVRPLTPNAIPLPPSYTASDVPNGCTVLVINASQNMAHEITVQLSSTLPGSTILFAPTLSLALWILKRRHIDLILSSASLPDGALSTLHEFIELMSPPPELVIISNLHSSRAEFASHPGYRFVELRRLSARNNGSVPEQAGIAKKISDLGADIRNDLNNPLQEIVAMAFVAHSSQGLSPAAEEALSAIQRAAGNMASVVNMLEDKIRGVVTTNVA
jgi:signal transduction histidine kinase